MPKILTPQEVERSFSRIRSTLNNLNIPNDEVDALEFSYVAIEQELQQMTIAARDQQEKFSQSQTENETLSRAIIVYEKKLSQSQTEMNRLKADNELTLSTSELARRAEIEHRQKNERLLKEIEEKCLSGSCSHAQDLLHRLLKGEKNECEE